MLSQADTGSAHAGRHSGRKQPDDADADSDSNDDADFNADGGVDSGQQDETSEDDAQAMLVRSSNKRQGKRAVAGYASPKHQQAEIMPQVSTWLQLH